MSANHFIFAILQQNILKTFICTGKIGRQGNPGERGPQGVYSENLSMGFSPPVYLTSAITTDVVWIVSNLVIYFKFNAIVIYFKPGDFFEFVNKRDIIVLKKKN